MDESHSISCRYGSAGKSHSSYNKRLTNVSKTKLKVYLIILEDSCAYTIVLADISFYTLKI